TVATNGWNARAFQPQSIDLDLGQAQSLARIQLVVSQSPPGYTTHTVYGGPTLSSLTALHTFSQNTQEGDRLTTLGPFPNVRFLRIATTSSPSWVAWHEVNVFKYCPVKVRSPGDLSADCRGDIALTGGSSNGMPWSTVPVVRSNGDGTFVPTNWNVGTLPQR